MTLQVLCLVITKGSLEEDNKLDITKNSILPGLLVNIIKGILKSD